MILKNIEYALILGKGKSGLAAQSLLSKEKVKTKIYEDTDLSITDFKKICKNEYFSHCIISPGFSKFHPWIKILNNLKINIVTEIELGWSRFKSRTIAITGSNGKSTALKLLFDTLSIKSNNVSIGGNYGIPASEIALKKNDYEWNLLEVSSFQLENIISFTPDISVIINIYPNHLNRYSSFEDYLLTKCKIFGSNQNPVKKCIIPLIQKKEIEKFTDGKRNWITFGENNAADYYSQNGIITKKENKKEIINLRGTLFGNNHLSLSTTPAITAILDNLNISLFNLKKAVESFEILPHRFEFIDEFKGVRFINDSKATNLHAMISGIKSCSKKIRLLAGGQLKEKKLTFLKEKLADYEVYLYVYGESALLFNDCCSGIIPCTIHEELNEAFLAAVQDAKSGDTILLSPGCASFDQFKNFEDRGDQFKLMVRRHIEEKKETYNE